MYSELVKHEELDAVSLPVKPETSPSPDGEARYAISGYEPGAKDHWQRKTAQVMEVSKPPTKVSFFFAILQSYYHSLEAPICTFFYDLLIHNCALRGLKK